MISRQGPATAQRIGAGCPASIKVPFRAHSAAPITRTAFAVRVCVSATTVGTATTQPAVQGPAFVPQGTVGRSARAGALAIQRYLAPARLTMRAVSVTLGGLGRTVPFGALVQMPTTPAPGTATAAMGPPMMVFVFVIHPSQDSTAACRVGVRVRLWAPAMTQACASVPSTRFEQAMDVRVAYQAALGAHVVPFVRME